MLVYNILKQHETSEVSKYHNSVFDEPRQQAHDFVTSELGLSPAPLDHIALIVPDQALHLRTQYGQNWGGGYNSVSNTAVVIQEEDKDKPLTQAIKNGAANVHEITHSATINMNEHMFWNEALAGIGEYKYLDWLKLQGKYQPAAAFMLERAGVRLWVPDNWRYTHKAEAANTAISGSNANTSQALLAALGVAHTLPKSGIKGTDILKVSTRGGSAQFDLMQKSVDSLKRGLAKEVETFPQTTDGIIQATSIIQAESLKK